MQKAHFSPPQFDALNSNSYPHYVGIKSQSNGKQFELLFLASAKRHKCTVSRIPDGCKVLGLNKIIRVRTPFDWIVTFEGRTAVVDTKTSEGLFFKGGNVPDHQLSELYKHELEGAIAGFVVRLKGARTVLFIAASTVYTNPGKLDHTHPEVIKLGGEDFDPRKIFNWKKGVPYKPKCAKQGCLNDSAPAPQIYCSRECSPLGHMVGFYHRDEG